jgi:hypothetical protein
MSSVSRLWPIVLLLCGSAQAAEPKFEPTIVTQSRTYERESGSFSVGGISAATKRVDVSRVTVALDGILVTGEWEPQTLVSTTAKDFRRGTDVQAAVTRNRLYLKLADGSVVNAKIVSREKQKPPEPERRTR